MRLADLFSPQQATVSQEKYDEDIRILRLTLDQLMEQLKSQCAVIATLKEVIHMQKGQERGASLSNPPSVTSVTNTLNKKMTSPHSWPRMQQILERKFTTDMLDKQADEAYNAIQDYNPIKGPKGLDDF